LDAINGAAPSASLVPPLKLGDTRLAADGVVSRDPIVEDRLTYQNVNELYQFGSSKSLYKVVTFAKCLSTQ
jgi:hypothetical protein